MQADGAADEKRPIHVGTHDLVPGFEGQVLEASAPCRARVVDQNIDVVETPEDLIDGRFHLVVLRDIAHD